MRDQAYEYENPSWLKENSSSQRNYQNQLRNPGLSHTEQECQESLIQEKILNQQNSRWPQIFMKLSFRELCNLKWSDLHAFENTTIMQWAKIG